MKKSFCMPGTVIIIGLCLISGIANATVTAKLDRDHIASGDTVRLLIQRDGSANGQPDIGALKNDFDILGSSSGSQVQIVNGSMSTKTQLQLTLAPKHDGVIQIPALEWNGEHTQALALTVGGNGGSGNGGGSSSNPAAAGNVGNAGNAGSNGHVMLTATPDQNQPYVQAAVVLTVQLSTDQPISQGSLDLAANDDVLIKQLGKDTQSNETRNGRNVQVIQRKYLLFPQHSGHIKLDGPVLTGQVPDTSGADPFNDDGIFGSMLQNSPLAAMMHGTKPLHLRSKPIELNVLARPATMTGATWVPALSVKLDESWSANSGSVHVGDPVTRHLHLEALGLTGAQLPDLNTLITAPDGVKVYPDKAKVEDSARGDTVLGVRDQDIAFIANQPGHYVLPEVKLVWWDTINNVQRVATLPQHEFDVVGAAGDVNANPAPGSGTPSQAASATNPASGATPSVLSKELSNFNAATIPVWLWLLAVGILLLLGALAGWLLSRRKPAAPVPKIEGKLDDQPNGVIESAPVNNGNPFKAFHKACMNNDARAARAHLLAWAKLHWPNNPPTGINALAKQLNRPELTEMLRQLDKCCYTDSAWQGEALARTFTQPTDTAPTLTHKNTLMELYP